MAEAEKKIFGEGAPEEKEPAESKRQAIALRYNVDKDKAPLVLATGRGPIADEIVRVAEDNKIPLYEDPELTALLGKIELDSNIPSELYIMVAEVLFFVYKLDRMAEKRQKLIKKIREEQKAKKEI
ncbi:MAG: EscU/YscU/HrcU family type III secretion system export apparatus switch protein [Candidatus Margulisbacteria bacterium]|nr:EscU/YscU/HrcU family type III secretion system export apparatus switch protein [Candidatus Margulisiibacteriota bacterium]MBU1021479.1 EscU/YscU/HrcU family type III secretion system export apparatus switch protein [Candidatus Margulisiibacteriota bacterium]MBU1728564.1 EscU/YscU/HrcU family type III secretion system export apparatus switch protein [Candidatus Margulisiibacteriota bacterium]MBU1955857.1 EscU/YscU/HrcU family type III secretion system export apparatus switch protein [Candidat